MPTNIRKKGNEMSSLKEKINAGQRLCGTHVTMADPSVCEMLGYLGFDFIWVDMEHTYLTCKDVLVHANAARAAGTPVFVRVPQHDLTYTKRILEMGVEGIIFPMVKSAEEMNELLSYTLYPPYGARGCGPMRGIRYGLDSMDEYVGEGHLKKVCRFIQIEHINAVEEIEAIASHPYLDGIFLGPFDLSGSIHQLGNIFGEDTTALIRRAVEVLKKHGKAIGVSTHSADPEVFRHWQDLGVQVIAAGADYSYIMAGAADVKKHLTDLQSE
jgi:2-dehydro-3-deoxyglucarate aldolase/4-hydroxy-2-oxoheptanedioate aldolase